MATIGIRELRNNLSRVIRQLESGEAIDVTDHGRIVARLSPPPIDGSIPSGLDRLIAEGVVRPAKLRGKLMRSWPALEGARTRRGLAKFLIDEDRGE